MMMQMDAHHASIADIRAAKRLHKQIYNRERLRQKSLVYKNEVQALNEEIAHLERCVETVKFDKTITLLSWKDVANVFKEQRGMSEEQLKSLKKQVSAMSRLRYVRTRCSNLMSVIPQRFPNPSTLTYKATSLMEDESLRLTGLEWISKRLYYNLDPWIERSRLPASNESYFRVDVRQTDESFVLEEYKQRVEQMSLAHAAACLETIYFESTEDDEIEVDDSRVMRYLRYPSWYGKAQNHSFHEKMLIRVFKEKSRYIIFTHSISDDAKYPDKIYGDWTAWVVAEELSPTHTVIRNGFVMHGARTSDGYLKLEEECPFLEQYTDEDVKFTKFEQYQKNYRARRQAGDLEHFATVAKSISIQ
ncbi:hypothetical protein LEN26_012515 [Aphanomyces euteiches]|nr:hypothetical protein LEN26_012515 [Aphanomyces euteiches]